MLKIALVTNTLAPYRVPVYSRIAQLAGIDLNVISCSAREPNRNWDLPRLDFDMTVLRENFVTFRDRYIHNNLDVVAALNKFSPGVVVTDGFNPTHLYAFLYALLNRIPHVAMTDGTEASEKNLTAVHKIVRRVVYSKSRAFISASEGGKRLYQQYGLTSDRFFKSCLCVENEKFANQFLPHERSFDFIFCGRIEPVKNPLFVIDVGVEVARRLKRTIRILFVGSGQLEGLVRKYAKQFQNKIDVAFHGFAAQNELPALYQSAKLFLFPSMWDPWGVVANEACAAGLPVIVSPFAGSAHELVVNEVNGFVCELDVSLWADKAEYLLTQSHAYGDFSRNSQSLVKHYNFDSAAVGLVAACQYAHCP